MAICKPIVKFVVSLTSLIKKKSTTFRKKKIYKNLGLFNYGIVKNQA